MSAHVTITCNRCGHSITGTTDEALAWDATHDEKCPKRKEATR